MIITITNKLGEDVQLWTFDIKEEDLMPIFEKYGARGESVLIDADDLPEDIKHYYKEYKPRGSAGLFLCSYNPAIIAGFFVCATALSGSI